jgi:hypothetical protein
MEKYTTIRVKDSTHSRISKLGNTSYTKNRVLEYLLDFYDNSRGKYQRFNDVEVKERLRKKLN